jgi:hypothetical protein
MPYAHVRKVTRGQAEYSRQHHGHTTLTEWRKAIERLPFTGPVAGSLSAGTITLTITRTATTGADVSRAADALERYLYPGTP